MGRARTLTYRDAAGTPSVRYQHIPAPPAIKLNLRVGDAVMSTTGRYMPSLPVEQQVALAWGVPRGRLAHAPEVGHDFLTLPRLNESGLRAEIQRRVPLATPVDRLIAAGEIEIISIRSEHPKTTESRLIVTYRLRGASQTQTFDSAHIGEVAAEPAPPPGPDDDDIVIWVMDNAPTGSTGGLQAELWGYSYAQVQQYGYSGPPARLIRLPPSTYAGRGHSFTILSTGHFVVCTTEALGDADNGGESWYVIQPDANGQLSEADCPRIRCDELFAGTGYATYGARHAFQFNDDSILLGSNGDWKQFTLSQLLNLATVDYATLPMWTYNGAGGISGIGHFDCLPVPGTRRLIVQGDDRFWQINLGLPVGAINGTDVPGGDGLDWIAGGSNIGSLADGGWGGFIARDAVGGIWKQRGAVEDIAYWSPGVIATLPKFTITPQANPAPTRTLTCPLITALDINIAGLFSGLDMDIDGGLWNLTQYWSADTAPAPAMLMRFAPEDVESGGDHMPDRLIYLPFREKGLSLRMAPQFRLQVR